MTPLYSHQRSFLSSNPAKSSLVWSCGTGKTRTALEWAKLYGSPVLIICPKALKANWERSCDEIGLSRGLLEKARIISKEEFRKSAATIPDHFGQVIVDEVHNGFLTPHFKSQMAKALKSFIDKRKISRVLLLTATPYTSSPWNIFNLAYLTGHRWPYQNFKFEFFNEVRMGPRIVPIAKKGSEKKLAPLIRSIANLVDIHDVMDVPLQHHAPPEYFALTPKQKRAIKEAYDPLPIVRYTQFHEIENGVLNKDGTEWVRFPHDKMDRIIALVEENPKIAIVCRYNEQLRAIRDALCSQGCGIKETPIYVINGDSKTRDQDCQAAETSAKAIILIQADCAEGYEIPSFPLCVFVSQSYSYVKWEQICGRFLRMNKPSRTTFLYLLTEGDSVDQGVYGAVRKKQDFRIELFSNERAQMASRVRQMG